MAYDWIKEIVSGKKKKKKCYETHYYYKEIIKCIYHNLYLMKDKPQPISKF